MNDEYTARKGVNHHITNLLCGFLATWAFVSCSFGSTGAFSESKSPSNIEDVYRVPNGTTIRVQGRFEGWNPCNDNTILKTRSDWTLAGNGRCIYVTGKRPKRVKMGQNINIKALIIDEDGKRYLHYLEE